MLIPILTSVIVISLLSLIGIFTLSMNKKLLEKWMLTLVAFAAGTLLGAAFFDIIPEVSHELGEISFMYILIGILIFFVIERFIFWHHCHTHNHDIKPHTYLNLIGDGVHNFVDGAIIAAAYLTDPMVGVVATIAIALHEIPQEIGDFAILVHGGLKPKTALMFNYLSAFAAVIGAVITFAIANIIEGIIPFLLALAGGGFVYIALGDILPELKEEGDFVKVTAQTIVMLLGVAVMFAVTHLLPASH